MNNITKYLISVAAILGMTLAVSSCNKEVKDEPENVQLFTLKIDNVREGDDVPVTLTFNKAGLTVDNDGWGDPWKKATFNAVVKDSFGHDIQSAIWSGPDGILTSGSKVDMPENGVLNLVLGGLRKGEYTVSVNLETRYTVDTWASGWVKVDDAVTPLRVVLVDDFSMPGKNDGAVIDDDGNLVLDLKYFNEARPFVYQSVISPIDATYKKLVATSENTAVLSAEVKGSSLLVLIPKTIGFSKLEVESMDGNVKKSINVKVIQTPPDADGYTLPIDDIDHGGDPMADFDVAGRLALDINKYPNGRCYEYECHPIPAEAVSLTLMATSDAPEIADVVVVNGHILNIYPKSVGYANIKVSKADGSHARTLRVAVISCGQIVLTAEEGAPSEQDKLSGVFPCRIKFSSTTAYVPPALTMDAYTRAVFRADITDPADHFVNDDLKNSKSAYAQTEESVMVAFIPGVTVYDIYERLMVKVAGTKYLVHHSADWPNYRDYYLYAKLYKLTLQFSLIKNYDTNLYRFEIYCEYNNPANMIYQYL